MSVTETGEARFVLCQETAPQSPAANSVRQTRLARFLVENKKGAEKNR